MAQPIDSYPTTLWTQTVHSAGDDDPTRKQAGWQRFLRTYHAPIEQTLRARLHQRTLRARSKELVDDFFSYLAAGNVLARADRARGPFRRFIQGVVRNFVLEVVRGRRHTGELDDAGLAELGAIDSAADDAEERGWFRGMVHAALTALAEDNPRQARALALRYGIPCCGAVEGQETMPAAIAVELDTTPHAVHELLRRAKRELRGILARRVADSLYAGAGSAYHDDFDRERRRMQERAGELWPGILREDATDEDATPTADPPLEDRDA